MSVHSLKVPPAVRPITSDVLPRAMQWLTCSRSSIVVWMMGPSMHPQQVYWWHKIWSGGHSAVQPCCPEGPPQAGQMGWQEPCEVQQGKVLSAAPRKEQFHTPAYAAHPHLKSSASEKDLGVFFEHQIKHEPTLCPSSKGDWYPGMLWAKYWQQDVVPLLLFTSGESLPKVLILFWAL